MARKKSPEIDWSELQGAWETGSPDVHHYLNTRTLEIETRGEDQEDELELSEQHLNIPHLSSREAWEHMQAFSETVSDPHAREQLERSLQGKGAFRRFKDAVHSLGLADAWFGFSDGMIYDLMLAWLDEQGIKPRNPPPARPQAPAASTSGALETQAGKLDDLAAELERAVSHARGAARLLRAGELARGWAHTLACHGHLRTGAAWLDEVAQDHAQHSRVPE